MAKYPNIPDDLHTRVQRQRKRQRFVRLSFGVTVAVTIILLFGLGQVHTFAPTVRDVLVYPDDSGYFLIDQQIDFSTDGRRSGTFGLLRLEGDKLTTGTRYDGSVLGVTFKDAQTLGITTGQRLLEFDLSAEQWPRTRIENFGLNDPDASATAIAVEGRYWLCWTRGTEIMVRPLEQPEVSAHSLHKISSAGAGIGGVTLEDRIWLAVRDRRSEELTLVCFRPRIVESDAMLSGEDGAVAEDADGVPHAKTRVEVIKRTRIAEKVRQGSITVLPGEPHDIPVVAFQPSGSRDWKLLIHNPDTNQWSEAALPERQAKPSGLEINNFTRLNRRGNELVVVYNDGRNVMLATGAINGTDLTWNAPLALPIGRTQGVGAYLIWLVLLGVVLMVMASQGVWLMLNRERPTDRTLATMLEKKIQADTDKPKVKPEPRLLYASSLARVMALFLDIAITSPIVILLQDVYQYSLEQAYGFLAFGGVSRLDATLPQTLIATLVTLLVLTIYSAIAEVIWGKTFGKALLRLKVVDLKGETPATWRVIVRNLLKVFELIHFLVLLVPMILLMMTRKQQRLGDLAAGTLVIVDALPEESPDDIDV